jgi:hypothetical protein
MPNIPRYGLEKLAVGSFCQIQKRLRSRTPGPPPETRALESAAG